MHWELLHSEVVCRCRIFSVRRNTSRPVRGGQTHDFHIIDTADWVSVVPVTAAGDVVLVRQFRHGIQTTTLEIPAGVIDPDDASPAAAARRELREETGYAGGELFPLGCVHPNPAIMTNRCHVFLARGVEYRAAPTWDQTEDLMIEVVPFARVEPLMRDGSISNALTMVALQLALSNGRPAETAV